MSEGRGGRPTRKPARKAGTRSGAKSGTKSGTKAGTRSGAKSGTKSGGTTAGSRRKTGSAEIGKRASGRTGGGPAAQRKPPGKPKREPETKRPVERRQDREREARPRPSEDEAEWVWGLHAVEEILEQRPQEVDRLLASREKTPRVGPLLKRARHAGVPVTYLARELLSRQIGGRGKNHQGVAARVAPKAYAPVAPIVERVLAESGVILLLDRVTDVGNLGAILRTAAGAGVAGVVLPADASVGLSAAVLRAASGAAEHVEVARIGAPLRWVESCKQRDIRVAVLDGAGERDWHELTLDGPTILIAGAEDRGVRDGLRKLADDRVRIPLAPGVDSLNVGVAVGVLLFRLLR